MKRKVLVTVLIALAILWATPAVWADATIGFTPASQTVALGNQANVTISVTNATRGVGNYDFQVAFDPTILAFAGSTDLTGFGFFEASPVSGSVGLLDFSLDDPDALLASQTFPLGLFTLTFDTLKVGTSDLTFIPTSSGGYPTTLGDVYGDSYGVTDTLTLNTGSITVAGSTVPEPASLTLLGIGILGLFRLRKK